MIDMATVLIDHYRILGLPTGAEGSKLDEKQITMAHKAMCMQLNPDKRLNDPYAKAKFRRLNSSYAILINRRARKEFHASYLKGLVLAEDQENIMFGLGLLIFVVGPLAFPARRNKYSFVATWFCYQFAFEGLCESYKLGKIWSMMIRVGDYFKRIRNPREDSVRVPIRPQAARTDEEQSSQENDYMTSIFNFLYWSAAQTGSVLRGEAYNQPLPDHDSRYEFDFWHAFEDVLRLSLQNP